MNEPDPTIDPTITIAQPSQLRFALTVLGIIAILCVGAGTFLLWKGYQSGELFVGIVGSIAGAIAGMLSMHQPNPTTPSGALATQMTNTKANPVPILDTHPEEPKPEEPKP